MFLTTSVLLLFCRPTRPDNHHQPRAAPAGRRDRRAPPAPAQSPTEGPARSMSLTDALDRYFAAWNDHDPKAVVASLVEGGTYEDPMTGGPVQGDVIAATVAGLLLAFPDVHFDLVSTAPTGPSQPPLNG